jgi:hypothetical protein
MGHLELKLFELISFDGFVLEEANDYRVDSKATLNEKCHLKYLIESKIVKHPTEVTKEDMLAIMDEVLGYEMQALANQPIAVSIYLFPYIYDL